MEILIEPIVALVRYFGKGQKHQQAIQITLLVLLGIAGITLTIGIGFILSSGDYLLPGIIRTSTSGFFLFAYLISALDLSRKKTK